MLSTQAHCQRFALALRISHEASIAPEAIAQACWALMFMLVSLAACIGAYHAYDFIATPGYPVEAFELLVICLVIALYGIASSIISGVHAVRLGLRHG